MDDAPPKPLVVIDTNVWVAAGFRPASDSARLIRALDEGRLRLVWNTFTRGETQYVLNKIPPLDWQRVARLFRDQDRYDGPTDPDQFVHVPDPDDRRFAALAAATGATLVSLDAHLLAKRSQAEIVIVTPSEYLAGG